MKLVFATNNENKVREINAVLPQNIEIISLKSAGITEDVPETQPTLQGNAEQKATFILENYQLDCFADDTGLEIEVLNNEPGIYSARYAGAERSDEKNIDLVLSKLSNKNNRSAQFRTVISLCLNGEKHFFEGIVKGEITAEKRGENGFGYDPVFQPEGSEKTFAEMSIDEKNQFSHRAKATRKLIDFLNVCN